MKILEIFRSIQGEGSYMGIPCIFIRFAGCNLHCDFCDTKESWGQSNAQEMSIQDILEEADKYNCSQVVITGGEPCMVEELPDLVDALIENGFCVGIETNGTLPTPKSKFKDALWVVCSPKPETNYQIHEDCHPDELKYVVTEEFDDQSAIPVTIRRRYPDKIWLQPDGYNMKEMWRKCVNIAFQDCRLRVGVQLHKIMEIK